MRGSMIDVRLKKTGDIVRLNKNNFVSAGGEGQIYAREGKVYKIFFDLKKTIPYKKIKELSLIQNSRVIKPEDLLINKKEEPVGYSMKHVKDTLVLCQTFPKVFRDREGLKNDTVLNLVLQLRKMVEDIHRANVLVVDLNEMNFLVDKKFCHIYAIDVDSFKTPSFPATALMESIRDRHSTTFNEGTDWFSFGIVSFQMFVGIHPFKGRYPKIRYPQDKMRELDERMLQNIPVFHPEVRYPNNVLPFDIIPQSYKQWFKSIFIKGERIAPPLDAVEVIFLPRIIKESVGDEYFSVKEISKFETDIIDYISINGTRIVITKNLDTYLNGKKSHNTSCMHFGITSKQNKVIGAKIENNKLALYDIETGKNLNCNLVAEEVFSYGGRLYIKNTDKISEIEFIEMKGSDIKSVARVIGGVMESATYIGSGVVIQNILGRFVISVFPNPKTNYQIPIPELDGSKIVDAKYDSQVLVVISSKHGKYDKFIIKFDNNYKKYSFIKTEDIHYCGINFVVLESGVTIHINESEEVEIFHNAKDASAVKVINSDTIDGNMRLFKDGSKVIFSKGNRLFSLKTK
jgi:hypothetical protein